MHHTNSAPDPKPNTKLVKHPMPSETHKIHPDSKYMADLVNQSASNETPQFHVDPKPINKLAKIPTSNEAHKVHLDPAYMTHLVTNLMLNETHTMSI